MPPISNEPPCARESDNEFVSQRGDKNGDKNGDKAVDADDKAQLSFDMRARSPERESDGVIVPPVWAGGLTASEPAPEAAPRPATPPRSEPRVLSVFELVRAARATMEARFADVRVQGEISGLKASGPGHLYFTLKDEAAQLDCVMFSREVARLKFRPDNGMLLRCRGRLTIFEGRGKFQLAVTAMEPAGAGALALAFEQLKQRLATEGLFDPERKRPLPFLPRRIGVVTSPTGAVIRDIIKVAHRRFPVPILLSPTPVQGEGAALQIIAALARLAQIPDVDVIIVARGGGSLEDLWAFNDEGLARAIAACPVPVISAVGHETDFTIADFVADLRAPTPSAAAERAVPMAEDLAGEMQLGTRRLHRAMESELRACRLRLERGRATLGDPRRWFDQRRQRLDDLASRVTSALRASTVRRRQALRETEARLLRAHPQRRIAEQRAALTAIERRLGDGASGLLSSRRRALESLTGKLGALSPLRVLDRGYSLTLGPDGRLVTRAADVTAGDAVTVRLREGGFAARVERVDGTPGKPQR